MWASLVALAIMLSIRQVCGTQGAVIAFVILLTGHCIYRYRKGHWFGDCVKPGTR